MQRIGTLRAYGLRRLFGVGWRDRADCTGRNARAREAACTPSDIANRTVAFGPVRRDTDVRR
ncbi:MAG TPA: hypothetical protein VFV24_00300, partial [Candidatus Eisenbacteria bacterium]|nr:hypothetical protein [Candidatus Eisenbacteria bacterium]